VGFSDLFVRRKKDDPDAADAASDLPLQPTRALPKFLASLNARQQPVLLDLGPVVGSNVTFFGEQLGCKIFVEDISKDIDRHTKEGTLDALPAFFAHRFPQEAGSVDGILCWDLFDYLDAPSARRLAGILTSTLKPGGVLYAFFGSKAEELTHYNRFVVEGRDRMSLRPMPATRTVRNVIVTRDINRMFEGLVVAESVLLKSNARETLFRKPS
jgi:hypothetical protein